MQKHIKKAIPILIIFLISFIFSINCVNNLWHTENPTVDSNVFIYVARMILNGKMPYLDVFDHKGPLLYLINTLGLITSNYKGLYLIEFISIFTTFYFIYKIANMKCNKVISILILLISTTPLFEYFEGGNFTEEFAMPFIAISSYIFIDYFLNKKINKKRLIICGLSLGSVLLLRPNMISLWIVMCISVLIKSIKEKEFNELKQFILWFFIGFILITFPIILWLSINGAFKDFINDYFIFNKTYSSYLETSKVIYNRIYTLNYFLTNPLYLSTIIIELYFYLKKRQNFELIYSAYLVLNLILISLSGRLYYHYGMILIPSLAYPFSLLSSNINKKYNYLIFIILTFIFPFSHYFNSINKMTQDYLTKNKPIYDENNEIANVIKKYTNKNDKIIICGNNNILYNLTNTYAASKYSFQVQSYIDKKMNQEFYDEINKNKPKIIFVKNIYFDYEKIMDYIKKENYKEIWHNYQNTKHIYIRKST